MRTVGAALDAVHAAELRAKYAIRTPDAVQVATPIDAGCQAFITNDATLARVTEVQSVLLSDLTP